MSLTRLSCRWPDISSAKRTPLSAPRWRRLRCGGERLTLSLPPQHVPRERVRRRSLSRLLRHMLLYTADADAP